MVSTLGVPYIQHSYEVRKIINSPTNLAFYQLASGRHKFWSSWLMSYTTSHVQPAKTIFKNTTSKTAPDIHSETASKHNAKTNNAYGGQLTGMPFFIRTVGERVVDKWCIRSGWFSNNSGACCRIVCSRFSAQDEGTPYQVLGSPLVRSGREGGRDKGHNRGQAR